AVDGHTYRVAVDGNALTPGRHDLLQRTPGSAPIVLAEIAVIPRGHAQRITTRGGAEISIGSDAPFGVMLLDLSSEPVPIDAAPVTPRGLVHFLGDPNTPIDGSVTVRLPVPPGVQESRRTHL